jgi:hypothetical protein
MKALDDWAVPGKEYCCSARCGYRFRVSGSPHDRQWSVHTDISYGYRTVGTWEEVREQYGDCAATLMKRYAPAPADEDEDQGDEPHVCDEECPFYRLLSTKPTAPSHPSAYPSALGFAVFLLAWFLSDMVMGTGPDTPTKTPGD